MNRRRGIIVSGGLLALLAAWFAPDERLPPTTQVLTVSRMGDVKSSEWPVLPDRSAIPIPAPANIFSGPVVRQAVLAKLPVPVTPPRPVAPPVPFSYLGRLQDGTESTTLFLMRADRVYAVRLGEVVDGDYRVEGIANGKLTFTYLPLNTKQTIGIGSDS